MATTVEVEVEVRSVSKSYGNTVVLDDVSLGFEKGLFAVVFGPPVSGKSVLMRLIMGLESPVRGEIVVRGRNVTREGAGQRNFGYVPQSFALYPHYKVFDNIAYPLVLARKGRSKIDERVNHFARQLKIEHLLQKFPNQLSGGEKQRVALARGMIKDASVFILDDPLAGLDFKLREQLFVELRDMLSEIEGTFIYTTSDPLETLALADHIFVLDDKRIIESAPVDQLYDSPQQLRSLQLVGFPAANIMPGELHQKTCRTPLGEFPVELKRHIDTPQEVRVGFRPESVLFGEIVDSNSEIRAEAQVLLREDLGAETLVYFEAASSRFIGFWSNGVPPPVSGDRFQISVEREGLLVFDAGSGDRLAQGAKTRPRLEISPAGASS